MYLEKYKLGCIIYSRMKSSRFPSKAKFKLDGITLLERVINRTKLIKINPTIVIATSTDSSDDYICDIAEKNNILFYRGSLENVFNRTINTLKFFKFDYFARICGDRPLLDPYLHELAFKQAIKGQLDLCSTNKPKTMPAGLTVEIISSKSFLSIDKKKLTQFNKEHITSMYYESKDFFKIESLSFPNKIDWPNVDRYSYTFDEKKDIEFLNYNIKNLKNVKFGVKYHLRLQKLASNWNKIPK